MRNTRSHAWRVVLNRCSLFWSLLLFLPHFLGDFLWRRGPFGHFGWFPMAMSDLA